MVLGTIKVTHPLTVKLYIYDGEDEDEDEDDDDVEGTRTGPYAVRPDVEHQVNHNATFSAHTKKAGQQARAKRAVWPCIHKYIYTYIHKMFTDISIQVYIYDTCHRYVCI